MNRARSVFFAALAALALLAEAHHESAPEKDAHAAASRESWLLAGPGEFVSVYTGGSFRIPSALP